MLSTLKLVKRSFQSVVRAQRLDMNGGRVAFIFVGDFNRVVRRWKAVGHYLQVRRRQIVLLDALLTILKSKSF